MNLLPRISLLTLIACLATLAFADSEREEAAADLDAVANQVKALQRTLDKQRKKESQAKQDLAKIEKAEQAARSELNKVRRRQKELTARQNELSKQANEQERQLAEQRALLGQQLRAAYMNGREEWLRMSLSQQDPAQSSRQQTYYQYLSRARANLVELVLAKLAELEATRAEIAAAAAELDELASQAAGKLADIAGTRKERQKIVAGLAAEISSQDAEIAALKAQERKLRELVAALDKMLRESKATYAEPFAGKTASLNWPAEGRLLSRFGQPRADGRMKWKGVLIGAAEGADVKAVYNGRVVYADWLDGMGLLMIVEHGDGYMSLYGHNQALLKEVGQTVSLGEVIAEVGDSGGQASPGLYFEIRKNGTAMNPGSWIK
jgi:septal ring factor EnvC (AmiA/AmiB activator)